MKKKLTAFVVAAALYYTVFVPAFANEITAPGDCDTTLTYSVETDYVVVIPESVKLDESIVITSSKANTEPGRAVKVRITDGLTDDGRAILDRDNDASNYAITTRVKLNGGDNIVTSDTVIASFVDVTAQTVGGTLTFADPVSPDENPIKAGSYTGFLTFTVSYEDA